jgi:hypothetical protein
MKVWTPVPGLKHAGTSFTGVTTFCVPIMSDKDLSGDSNG